MSNNKAICVWNSVYKMFDDESVNKKLTVLSKYEAILDDGRNPFDDVETKIEDILELGKCYRFVMTVEEVPESEFQPVQDILS